MTASHFSPNDATRNADVDRLPWLSDVPQPTHRRRNGELIGWAVVGTVLLAGASFVAGLHSVARDAQRQASRSTQATVPLPQPRTDRGVESSTTLSRDLPGAAVIEPAQPAGSPPAPAIAPSARSERSGPSASGANDGSPSEGDNDDADGTADKDKFWSPREVEGASGRLVRIGSFASEREAREGWTKALRRHPGMQTLPLHIVEGQSLRDGRTFYRLQVGTSSQAHSEVICQRMRAVAQSCVVVGAEEVSSQ